MWKFREVVHEDSFCVNRTWFTNQFNLVARSCGQMFHNLDFPSNTCVLVPWPFRLLHQYRSPYRGEGSRCLFSHLFLVIYSLFLSNILLLLFMSFTNNNISNNILVVSITLSFSVQSQLRDLNVGSSVSIPPQRLSEGKIMSPPRSAVKTQVILLCWPR